MAGLEICEDRLEEQRNIRPLACDTLEKFSECVQTRRRKDLVPPHRAEFVRALVPRRVLLSQK